MLVHALFHTSRRVNLRSDSIFSGDILLLVDIHFHKGNAIGFAVLLCQLFEYRCDHMAWTAPNGMEVDDHVLVRGQKSLKL